MERWRNDLYVAVRTLARRPAFSVTVVVTLALGVGANTALFGVFRAVFLEPLTIPDPDQMVVVMEESGFGCCGPASGPDFRDLRERQRSFDGMAILSPTTANLTGLDEPRRVAGTQVSAGAFPMVGVEPLLGRWLLPEDETPATPQVVVLAEAFWRGALGGDPDVLGRSVELDGVPRTVVGVMPDGFDVGSPWARTVSYQFYLPFPAERLNGGRGNHSFPVVARMAAGVDVEAAQADMERIFREIEAENPDTHGGRRPHVASVHEWLYGDVGDQLLLILGAAGLVLLIACGNVAGLQLARAVGRESELAVRAALGASRGGLVRLLFSESLVLAVAGGVGGVMVAYLAVDALRALLPPTMPRVEQIEIGAPALLFALAASGVTALVFGMLPALLAARGNLAASVKEGGYATLAPAKERARDAFIVAQIALGLVLVNAGALLVRSYGELRSQEQGFEDEGVLTWALSAAGPRYGTLAARQAYYEQVVERVAAVPGVRSVGVASKLPLAGGTNGNVWIEGQPMPESGQGMLAEVSSVAGDYFGALGIPLRMGRPLETVDTASGAIGVLVNQAFADAAWPDENPLGRRFSFSTPEPEWRTVVGVVGNVRQWRPEEPPLAEVYYPYASGWAGGGNVVARVSGEPAALTAELRRATLEVDPTQPPSQFRTMTDRVDAAFAQRRFYTTLIALFAVSALFLAAAGIYGTVSYFVSRRIRELGIRMALGAGGGGIVTLVLKRAARTALWGVALGLVGVWASTSLFERLVYGVESTDVPTLVAGAAVLALAVGAASVLPAVRAVRVSPVLALRSE